MSHFSSPVVRIGKSAKHPNAETLRIWNGPQGPIIYRDGQFRDGDLAAFVTLDSIVDVSRPEFSFLADKAKDGKCRIRPIRLRGLPSVGLLVPVPPGLSEGDDASTALAVTKYEPPQVHSFGTDALAEKAPSDVFGLSEYDVENVWNIDQFSSLDGSITSETPIRWHISEKIHGCNARYTYSDGKFHLGSKRRWVKDDGKNVWSIALRKLIDRVGEDELKGLLKNFVLFGEVYGRVQDLHYGIPNDVDFVAFDLYEKAGSRFLSPRMLDKVYGLPAKIRVTPQTFDSFGTLRQVVDILSEAKKSMYSQFAAQNGVKQMSEGVVIRPQDSDILVKCRKGISRLLVKVVTDEYLQRQNGTEHTE